MNSIQERVNDQYKYAVSKYGDHILGVFLYGSQNYNIHTEDSDIDIIIVSKKIKSLLTIGAILEELKEALEKDVDLIEEECFEGEMDEDEQKFYDAIKKERVKIYG